MFIHLRITFCLPLPNKHLSIILQLVGVLTSQCLYHIDSGATGDFISRTLLNQLGVSPIKNPRLMFIQNILGKSLGRGRITHHSPQITIQLTPEHTESLSFWVLEGSTSDIVLGRPWLQRNQPYVDWTTGSITGWQVKKPGEDSPPI